MYKPKVFISFDYDHDLDLKTLLVGQAAHPDTPFNIVDKSVKEAFLGDWKTKVRTRIKNADQVIVICGEHTGSATGVNTELQIAQEESKPYFLLWGRSNKVCVAPSAAKRTDKVYKWTWENLKALIGGAR